MLNPTDVIPNRCYNKPMLCQNTGARTESREVYLRSNIAPTLEALDAKT